MIQCRKKMAHDVHAWSKYPNLISGIPSIKFLFTLILIVTSCSAGKKDDSIYSRCMEKFSDEKSCLELADPEKKSEVQKTETVSQDGLFIRKELKNRLQGKNRQYVIRLLGQPDRIANSSGYTYFYYNRPITTYIQGNRPDRELTVVLRRGIVSRVDHLAPEKLKTKKEN